MTFCCAFHTLLPLSKSSFPQWKAQWMSQCSARPPHTEHWFEVIPDRTWLKVIPDWTQLQQIRPVFLPPVTLIRLAEVRNRLFWTETSLTGSGRLGAVWGKTALFVSGHESTQGWFAGSGVCFAVQFGADSPLVFHTLAVKARCQPDGCWYGMKCLRVASSRQSGAARSNYLPCRKAPGLWSVIISEVLHPLLRVWTVSNWCSSLPGVVFACNELAGAPAILFMSRGTGLTARRGGSCEKRDGFFVAVLETGWMESSRQSAVLSPLPGTADVVRGL